MSYIGNEPIVSATRTITEISATSGQTVFVANGGYTVGKIDVLINGAELQSTDYTATNGSSVTLNNACAAGDDVKLVAWGTFSVANIPSGALSPGAPTWSSTGVSLPRCDTVYEGGQLNFNRALDNVGNWYIDSYGNTATPSLRFIDGNSVRLAIDGSGRLTTPSQPAFEASANPGYSGASTISFANTAFNIGNHWNGSTTFTAPVTGVYWFGFSAMSSANTVTSNVGIRVNGTSMMNSYTQNGSYYRHNINILLYLNANDSVSLYNEHGSLHPYWDSFSGRLVG